WTVVPELCSRDGIEHAAETPMGHNAAEGRDDRIPGQCRIKFYDRFTRITINPMGCSRGKLLHPGPIKRIAEAKFAHALALLSEEGFEHPIDFGVGPRAQIGDGSHCRSKLALLLP